MSERRPLRSRPAVCSPPGIPRPDDRHHSHGSFTSYFCLDPDNPERSSYSLFEAVAEKRALDPVSLVVPTGAEGLSLIPAAVPLATLDCQSGRLDGPGLVLKRAVDQQREQFDYALIDCPPVLGMLVINVLAACDRLVVPVQTEFLAISGLDPVHHTLQMVTRARPTPLDLVVVPTFFDQRTRASRDGLEVLRRDDADHLWSDVIPIGTGFREASRVGMLTALFDPRARGVEAYARLLEELAQQTPIGSREAV